MCKRTIPWMGLTLVAFGCATGDVRGQLTPAYDEDSYRTIALAEGPAPEGFRRNPLSDELERKAWEILKTPLRSKRWELSEAGEADLVLHVGTGRAPEDDVDAFGDDALVVDVFSRRTGKRVWFGYANDLAPVRADELDETLSELMITFPELPPEPAVY